MMPIKNLKFRAIKKTWPYMEYLVSGFEKQNKVNKMNIYFEK